MDSVKNVKEKLSFNRNIALQEAEFYNNEKIKAEKIAQIRGWVIVTAVMAVILVVMGFLLRLQRIKLANLHLENQLHELSESMSRYQSDVKVLSDREKSILEREEAIRNIRDSINTELSETVEIRKNLSKRLFETWLNPLLELSSLYFDSETTEKEKASLRKKLDKIIRDLDSETTSKKIIELANSINDGMLGELKEEVTKIDDRDIRFLIFQQAGCSTNVISLLLNVSPAYCRNIKKRLIEKVYNSKSERACHIMGCLMS